MEYEGHEIKLVSNPVEIVGIYPSFFNGDETPCTETKYISTENNFFLLSELKQMPDYDWESEDFGFLNAD